MRIFAVLVMLALGLAACSRGKIEPVPAAPASAPAEVEQAPDVPVVLSKEEAMESAASTVTEENAEAEADKLMREIEGDK